MIQHESAASLRFFRSFSLLMVSLLIVVACSNGGGGGGGDGDGGSSDECAGGTASGGPGATITNVCLASSSGTKTIEIGDIIRFEVSVTTTDGRDYDTLFWSLSGDATAAEGSTSGSGWAGVSNTVTDWDCHYQPAGMSTVDMGVVNLRAPGGPFTNAVPGRVAGSYGFFASSQTGDGDTSLIGTVTVQADAAGTFTAGGMIYPGVDGFLGSAGADTVTVSGGSFTVVP